MGAHFFFYHIQQCTAHAFAMNIGQYDIVLVNLDPTIGSEIRKTRPCVVISPDEMNAHLRTVIVAPMTTS